MRVYRLSWDEAYQSLRLQDSDLLASPRLHFESISKLANWLPIQVQSSNEGQPEPDFWRIEGFNQVLAVSDEIEPRLDILWAVCEALPIYLGDRKLLLVNVTEGGCYDALDLERSVWPSGDRSGLPSIYAFNKKMLDLPSLFTVPETCEQELYVYEYDGNPNEEFKGKIKALGLTGLRFEEIWSSPNT